MKHFKTIIILGKPGAGKGTQAELLASETGFRHIATGDILRERIKRQDPLGVKIKKLINEGKFVSDDIVLTVTFEAIKKAYKEGEEGVILDGIPRNLSQGEAIDGFLKGENCEPPLAINIAISKTEAIFRIVNRKTCSKCKKTIPFSKETAKLKKCPKCRAKLIIRPDDSEEIVKKRLTIYEEDTAPLADYYKNKGFLKEVDGERSIEEISENIFKLI